MRAPIRLQCHTCKEMRPSSCIFSSAITNPARPTHTKTLPVPPPVHTVARLWYLLLLSGRHYRRVACKPRGHHNPRPPGDPAPQLRVQGMDSGAPLGLCVVRRFRPPQAGVAPTPWVQLFSSHTKQHADNTTVNTTLAPHSTKSQRHVNTLSTPRQHYSNIRSNFAPHSSLRAPLSKALTKSCNTFSDLSSALFGFVQLAFRAYFLANYRTINFQVWHLWPRRTDSITLIIPLSTCALPALARA